ncbi:Predicted ATP-dependent carboligase, ATP-grasp superfamily [Faunimonas pinastri]|uniref:Predicted ATP-dependent carboligase, ATP-grasp superfamily n=1 Tax=Faunimonas pinastri TaxID=1855383 RepID=A0A1H9NLE8_9HYPH|nr:hypothetical protein [Faunimonas pinastri]SER36485.1 Predicted ATP-dependent carboligase, ATP-grasp superfamily [Faunimonas pinastri]
MTSSPGALILGGALGSLGAIRSLGRKGVPVAYVTHDNRLPKFSRYVRLFSEWPGPEYPDALEALLGLAERHGLKGWVVLAGADAEMRFLSQNRERLSAVFRVPTPSWDVVRWAYDKHLTYDRAAEIGIGYPRSFYPRSRAELDGIECRFPVILKPTRREARNAFTLAKAWRANDPKALRSLYSRAVELVGADAIVMQEMIPGGGEAQFSYAALWQDGEALASMVAVRTRQYPMEFGYTSSLVRSVENVDVEEAAKRFLRSLDFSGLVEIEFKYDARDDTYNILDVNARIWNWISLGDAVGIDFAYLAWRQAMDLPVEPVRAEGDAVWLHASRDVAAALQERGAGLLTWKSYRRSLAGKRAFGVFAADDPLPAIVENPMLAVRLLTRRVPIMLGTLLRRGEQDDEDAPKADKRAPGA